MLVLTRKYQEKIKIGDNITITVLRMKGKAVRLGIEAPTDVPVIRGELSFVVDGDEQVDVQTESALRTTKPGRTEGRALGEGAQWAADSRPVAETAAKREPATVGFARIPRNKVAAALPKFVSGSAPLRGMMDQR
jgi:carbon storage regulator CsrA